MITNKIEIIEAYTFEIHLNGMKIKEFATRNAAEIFCIELRKLLN